MASVEQANVSDSDEIDHGTLIDWVNEADETTQDSREMSEKCRNFYDSRQWSDAEAKALKRRKQAPVVINRIKPKIDGLMGMERANRTTAKAFPRTPKHTAGAQAATEAIRFVMDDQFYRQIRSSAWDNLCVEGSAGVEVIVKEKQKGYFCVTLNHVMWDRMIYDPHSRKKDFSDARYLGQVLWVDYDLAKRRFPDSEEMLEAMISGSSTYDDKPKWMDTKRRRVKVVELYFLDGDDWYYACFTRGGYLKDKMKSPYLNEDGETEHAYEFASLFVDLEGNRYGSVLQYLDVQEEINKRRSKALHLMSVRQVRGERGAVEDVEKARQELAKPDGYIETTPGMEFEVLKTGDMAQAQFKLLEESKLEIDAVGYSAAASGKEERLMSGVALRNREAAAQTELAPMFDVLKHLDVRVYRKIWNRIRQYWKDEKWIRVTDDPSTVKFVGLNRKTTKGQLLLEQAQQQNLPPEKLQQLQMQIQSDPSMQEQVMDNTVEELDVDIVIDDAPDSVTVQQEEFTALSEMVKSGIPIPPTAIIESSSLKGKDRILKEMREGMAIPPQIQERMQMMEEQAKKLAEENQALKADQSTEVMKIQAKQQADQASHQHEVQMSAATHEQTRVQSEREFALKAQQAEREFAMKKEAQDRDIQLSREKAEAEVALKLLTADAEQQIAEREHQAKTALGEKEHKVKAEQGEKELALKADAQRKEHEMKRAEQTKTDEETAMPNFMKALEKMFGSLEKIVESQAKSNEQIAKAMEAIAAAQSKPKPPATVRLEGIKRDAEGMLTGASASIN